MNQLQKALESIRKRLRKKRQQAEDAFVTENRCKKTVNCKHCGPELTEGRLWGCKILAMGENGLEASTCHDYKASYCSLFEASRSHNSLREEFQDYTPDQLSIRWPAVGELIHVEKLLSSLVESRDE